MKTVSVPNIEKIKAVLQDLDIYWRYNPLPYAISSNEISEIKKFSFVEKYVFTYTKKMYSFILKDLSLIGFESKSSGFYYFQSPFTNLNEYLDAYSLCTEDVLTDSDFMLDELKMKLYPFYARYDYSESQYSEGRHPAAHIHLGIDTEIRVACEKKLKPSSFVLFILRQFYPEIWASFCSSTNVHRDVLLKSVRTSLDEVPMSFRQEKDFFEMYFV